VGVEGAPWAIPASPVSRSGYYEGITGPIITVCNEYVSPKAAVGARLQFDMVKWFSERSRIRMVVPGNHLNSVVQRDPAWPLDTRNWLF
jgi:hypothetical protein